MTQHAEYECRAASASLPDRGADRTLGVQGRSCSTSQSAGEA